MNPAELIKKYIELRDWLEADTAAVDARQKPYKDGMVAIEGMVQQELIKDGADNIKTPFGTAYRTTHMSVKMADRGTFEQFVSSLPEPFSYFTNAVSKEKIKEYIEANGAAPPGIDITTIAKVNFRRS